jgi:hypothetical protein
MDNSQRTDHIVANSVTEPTMKFNTHSPEGIQLSKRPAMDLEMAVCDASQVSDMKQTNKQTNSVSFSPQANYTN